jgi:hypothetical protein
VKVLSRRAEQTFTVSQEKATSCNLLKFPAQQTNSRVLRAQLDTQEGRWQLGDPLDEDWKRVTLFGVAAFPRRRVNCLVQQ